MLNTIEVMNISKHFASHTAVDDISFAVSKGSIFGLLGPNAAGKSTTIRLLSGIIALDAGQATILGYDLSSQTEQIKARIGYVAQFFALYPELTVSENLDFYGAIYSHLDGEKKKRLLADYGLAKVEHQRAGHLSGGYKRRLSIACALCHDPEVIFLDEPTAGIDPVTRKELWDQFYALAAEGKTLFVTTHYMEEAERCNNLAFIHHGKLVATGTPSSLVSSFRDMHVFRVPVEHNPQLRDQLQCMPGVLVLNQYGEELRVITDKSVKNGMIKEIIDEFYQKEVQVTEAQATIEDVFITLTNEESVS